MISINVLKKIHAKLGSGGYFILGSLGFFVGYRYCIGPMLVQRKREASMKYADIVYERQKEREIEAGSPMNN